MCARDMKHRLPPRAATQRGLSIVELMVGIVVSMLVGLAATTSAVMFTASQRQGFGVGGASVNAGTVLTAIKGDAALAGLGYFAESRPLCSSLNLSNEAVVVSDGAAMAPLQATTDGDSDILSLLYASVVESGTNVSVGAPSDTTSVQLRSLLPAAVGQTVVMAPGPEEAVGLCTVRSVTAVTPAAGTTPLTLSFGNTGTHNKAAFANTPTYAKYSRVSLLNNVQWNRYRVTGGNLVLERPVNGAATSVLVRNVIAFRVQYGISAAANTTTLDSWVNATGAYAAITPANIDFIRAARIAVLVRSPQREKVDNAGNCVATETAPQVFGTTPTAFTGASTDWKCFRYRTSTVIVPLRNFVM